MEQTVVLLRVARAAGTDLGRRASEYMDRGDLVPDELIVAMVQDAIAGLDGKPILLDGFPRTVMQANALAEDAHNAPGASGQRLRAATSKSTSTSASTRAKRLVTRLRPTGAVRAPAHAGR